MGTFFHVQSWFGYWKVYQYGHLIGDEEWIATFKTEIAARRYTNWRNGFQDLDDE